MPRKMEYGLMKKSNVVDVHESTRNGVDGKRRYAFESEFIHNILAVRYYCGKTDVKAVGYFLIYISSYYERHYFDFTH